MSLPKWVKYTAIDRWGRKWAYSHKPEIKNYQGREIWSALEVENSKMQLISLGSLHPDWKNSLAEVHKPASEHL
jgi:hypothetical protein